MLILWTILIATSTAQKVYESTEDIGPEAFLNVTTLYPISYNVTNNNTTVNKNDITIDTNTTKTKESDLKDDKNKLDATVWKIEAAFAESNLDKHEKNTTNEVEDKKNDTKEFRPSVHLGTFYDDEVVHAIPTRASFGSFKSLKKPSSGFVSSFHDDHQFKLPKQILQTHKAYPYKFETPILTRLKDPWKSRGQDSLESKPTAEVPVKVPAGGLYKYQDPFQERPGEDDFGLEFSDGKDSDNPVKKRINSWERFLQLVTAFLPVGLIISALTPNIITIENGPPANTYPSNIFRRTDRDVLEPPSMTAPPTAAELPRISERCRRRLLCELHSDNHYNEVEKSARRRGKQCFKIRCDDTEALAQTLTWLLHQRQYSKGQTSYN